MESYPNARRGSTFQTDLARGSARGPGNLVSPVTLPNRSSSISQLTAVTFGNSLLAVNRKCQGIPDRSRSGISATAPFLSQPCVSRQAASVSHCAGIANEEALKLIRHGCVEVAVGLVLGVQKDDAGLAAALAKILFEMMLSVAVPVPARSGRVIAHTPALSQRPGMRF